MTVKLFEAYNNDDGSYEFNIEVDGKFYPLSNVRPEITCEPVEGDEKTSKMSITFAFDSTAPFDDTL